MDSKPKSYEGYESEANLLFDSSKSASDDEQSVLMRSRKEFNLTSNLKRIPGNASQESHKSRTPKDNLQLLWQRFEPPFDPKKGYRTNLYDKTVTCSVLKTMENKEASDSLIMKNTEKPTSPPGKNLQDICAEGSLSSSPRNHKLLDPLPPRSDEPETLLNMIENVTSHSFEVLRDVNGRVDIRNDIGEMVTAVADLSNYGIIRHTRGDTDITQVPAISSDELSNTSHPSLRNASARMHLPSGAKVGGHSFENVPRTCRVSFPQDSWLGARSNPSSEIELKSREVESSPRLGTPTPSLCDEFRQGMLTNIRINVERDSDGSDTRSRTVTFIRSAQGSCDLAANLDRSVQEVDDELAQPVLRTADGKIDLPSAAATSYEVGGSLVRVLPGPTYPSWDTLSVNEMMLLDGAACTSLSKVPKETKKNVSGNELAYEISASSTCNAGTPILGRSESCPVSSPKSSLTTVKSHKNAQINYVFSMSDVDLVYGRNSEKSESDFPSSSGTETPRFSLLGNKYSGSLELLWKTSDVKYILHPDRAIHFAQDTSSEVELDSIPKRPELYQIYVAKTKTDKDGGNTSGSSSRESGPHPSGELKTTENSDSEPSSGSSQAVTESNSLLETLEHTGSARLLENLPGLDDQRGQFDKPHYLPTAQELQEMEDEMLKLATRSKRYVPPMDLGLCEWESIIQVLGMEEPTSVLRVLCRLSRMTTKRYCDLVRFYKCGLYDYLMTLMLKNPEVDLIQNLSLKLIAELSCLPECREQILQSPRLINHCMTLLEDDTSKMHFHEYSSKILSAISNDKNVQQSLLDERDLIEVLLRRIINSPDPDVRCNCMEILLRVANNETTSKCVIRSEQFSLDLFITLIDSKYSKIQQLSLGMLVLLTRYETDMAFQESVQAAGIAELMVEILKKESMIDFAHLVVAIICNIGNTEFGLNFLRYSGTIKFLVDYIDQEGREDILGCGLDIVVKLSMSKGGRALMVEFGCPERLVRYLKHEEDTALERSCLAIAYVSQNLEALCTMVAQKPAEDLIRLIYEDKNSAQLKYSAARALFEMAGRDEQMCQQIAELHLTEVFYHVIWSGFAHVPTLAAISDIIQTISQYPALKQLMIDDESVACFLDIMQGHCRSANISEEQLEDEESLRISGMQCLRAYMTDPLCRTLFSNAFGVYVLRGNLQSPSILIRQATAVFIELAARDPNLAAEMVVAGIVDIMRKDKPMMTACPAWKKALQQLYDNHLPSKFAYLHRLEISDITVDGFYITATNKGNIEVLDNLLHERKCPLETIYVCNFSKEHREPDRSVHVIMRPKWQPYIRRSSYPPAFSRLGDRSVAKIWRRKVSLLYGDKSPTRSPVNSLEISPNVSPSSSLTFGRQGIIRNRTSSLNRRLKGRKSKFQGRSLTSVKSHYDLPNASETKYAELNTALEKYGVCPLDSELGVYLEFLMEELAEKMGDKDEDEEDSQNSFVADKGIGKVAQILAKFVALRMCGNTDNMPNLINFFNVTVWELKERDETNIIPLGHLRAGLYLERSLLFKVLADRIGLPCTLVRGAYGIAFNEICIPCPNNEFPLQWKLMRPNFIVDLMNDVGELYFIESREAYNYCNAPF